MSVFEGGSSIRYHWATIDMMKKNLDILQQNQIL